jgi:hypothetical protein
MIIAAARVALGDVDYRPPSIPPEMRQPMWWQTDHFDAR